MNSNNIIHVLACALTFILVAIGVCFVWFLAAKLIYYVLSFIVNADTDLVTTFIV